MKCQTPKQGIVSATLNQQHVVRIWERGTSKCRTQGHVNHITQKSLTENTWKECTYVYK